MKKLIMLLFLPVIVYGQMNLQAKVTVDKRTDMTIVKYMYGPVIADTAYIGESDYQIPKYLQPVHSQLSKVFWTWKLLNALNNGQMLIYYDAKGSIPLNCPPGTMNQNIDNAVVLVNLLAVDVWGVITNETGSSIYELKGN